LATLVITLSPAGACDHAWKLVRRAAGYLHQRGASAEIFILALLDALPILFTPSRIGTPRGEMLVGVLTQARRQSAPGRHAHEHRSEEHTSELQSLAYLVCRLLLEKKKP